MVSKCVYYPIIMINTPTKIKIEILKKGTSGADIARSLGYTRVAVYHVIEGRSKSPRIRRAICDALDLPYSIWEEMDEKKAA